AEHETPYTITAAEPEPPEVDKSALEAKIAEAGALVETDYTPETWGPFAEALAAAIDVYENPDATQEEVDSALAALTEAMAGLEEALDTVETPTADPSAGAVRRGTSVELSTSTEDATIYYTTDGTEPTTASDEYSEPITVNSAMTIKAFAVKPGMIDSAVATFKYTIRSVSGGGGGVAPVSGTLVTTSGGEVTKLGATIEIPAGALTSSIRVEVAKVTDTSDLPVPDDCRLVSDVLDITKDRSGDFKKPVTITMPFDKAEVDADQETVSIYWLDEEADVWVELKNVEVDWEAGKVSGEVDHFTKFAVLATAEVSDVPEPPEPVVPTFTDIVGHWAQQDIETMVELGLVAGISDTEFAPNRTITRAEFAALLVRAVGIDAGDVTTSRFADVKAGAWYHNVVNAAADAGLVSGYSATTFGPNDQITREQMASMVTRALAYKGKGVTLTDAEVEAKLAGFSDRNEIADWAQRSVAEAVESGIVAGRTLDTFAPKADATRAEGAVMILRMYNQI
ncbi:MAG: S-layer homology domain-containing protein, partial [Candidatus Desulforudis sp.]|nr:S-layer homology domain-containing protein [Desulforudis sp.]